MILGIEKVSAPPFTTIDDIFSMLKAWSITFKVLVNFVTNDLRSNLP